MNPVKEKRTPAVISICKYHSAVNEKLDSFSFVCQLLTTRGQSRTKHAEVFVSEVKMENDA